MTPLIVILIIMIHHSWGTITINGRAGIFEGRYSLESRIGECVSVCVPGVVKVVLIRTATRRWASSAMLMAGPVHFFPLRRI